MVTNISIKIGKIGLFTIIRSPGIPKRIAISPSLRGSVLNFLGWSLLSFVSHIRYRASVLCRTGYTRF